MQNPTSEIELEFSAHRTVLETRRPQSYDSFSRRTGRWFDVRVYPNSAGGVSGFFRDLTARKETEDELRRAKDVAEKASQANSEFLATLSHEMRTPLNPVILTLDLLEANELFPATLLPELKSMRHHINLETHIISDLLDITRIERGKLRLEQNEVDLHSVIRDVIKMCYRPEGPQFVADLAARQHYLSGDAVRIRQVVWNLLSNAQKFTDISGSVKIQTTSDETGRVKLEVIDSGSGIASELLPKLFSAFEQGEAKTARQRGGLGLGLSIVKKIVEAHNGTIAVASEGVGQGATFIVDLPTILQLVPSLPEAKPADPATSIGDISVLLVEDHTPTMLAMVAILKLIGLRVVTATNCAEAVTAAATGKYDLLISDIGLPDGTGLSLIQRLHPQFSHRAIALSGYGFEEDITASLKAGFSEHLTKLIDANLLKLAITRIVRAEPRS